MTQAEIDRAKELRAAGLSYTKIEAAMGREGKKGFWAMKALRAGGPTPEGSGGGRRCAEYVELSLWKAADGGRSAKRVRDAVMFALGVKLKIPTKNRPAELDWDGRYSLFVPADRFAEVRDFLMHDARLYGMQKTDDLSCPVAR